MALDPLAPVRFGLRIGIGVVRFELRVVEHLLGLAADREPPVAQPKPGGMEGVRVPVQHQPERAPEPPEPPVQAAPAEPPPEAQPAHIDTEPELVGEFAEAGAEEGAGPEIHVDEPWTDYRKTPVAAIKDRVAVAGAEELAVVQLYETMHRKRRSVLDAVERRSKALANAPAAHSNGR